LLVTIKDSANITTTSSVAVTVSSGLSGITVSLNGVSPTETGITFNNASVGYTIAQGTGGTIYLSNGSTSASIIDSSGSNTIGAPIVMESNTTIDAASGDTLTLSGSISSNNANALTVNGAGKVALSGTNTYTGGATVADGTLVLDGAQTIEAGTSLVIGNSQSLGAVFLAPANTASVVSTQTDVSSAQPVILEPARQHSTVLPVIPANHHHLGKSIGIAPVFKPGSPWTIESAIGAAMSPRAIEALAKYHLASRK
jgi:autotransporter-associated beta strand protein